MLDIEFFIWYVVWDSLGEIFIVINIGIKIGLINVYLVDVELINKLIIVVSRIMFIIVVCFGKFIVFRFFVLYRVNIVLMLDWLKVDKNCV